MIKQDKFGNWRKYDFVDYGNFMCLEFEFNSPEEQHKYGDETDHPHENPNIKCDCGSEEFKVCWWDYPYSGGFCKIVCTKCNKELILIDDYA